MLEIQKLIALRNIPSLFSESEKNKISGVITDPDIFAAKRQELLTVLDNEIYGTAPSAPKDLTVKKTDISRKISDFSGKAAVSELEISFGTDKGIFSFKATEVVPVSEVPVPVFVFGNFRPDVPDRYYPAEEIIDSGCAVVVFDFNDVTLNKDDKFSSGLAAMYERSRYSWGKIRMWAWAESRIMDYLMTCDYADKKRIASVGHSRLGKTALVCAAYDDRFSLACGNNSGCSGDALTRCKKGERVRQITDNFPYWFCDNYRKYRDREDEMPFDQHFLLAAIAPRRISLGAAFEDEWADPDSQYLSACAASEIYEKMGLKGFVHPDRLPMPGDRFASGEITYHLRSGKHFFSRTDWLVYIDEIKKSVVQLKN